MVGTSRALSLDMRDANPTRTARVNHSPAPTADTLAALTTVRGLVYLTVAERQLAGARSVAS